MKIKNVRIFLIIVLCAFLVGSLSVLAINTYVINNAKENIITAEEATRLKEIDCIIVLGCKVYDNGVPSDRLMDRILRGIELYDLKVAPKLLMSGDHGRQEYNEVGAMKEVAVKSGIASSDVFMDHAGFSTYESIYRAKEIFGADKIVIVTQKYHLYRALYIAKQLGIEAYGVESDFHTYKDATKSEFREILARVKDFGIAFLKPKPTYLGTPIAINGNGDVTNDYRDY